MQTAENNNEMLNQFMKLMAEQKVVKGQEGVALTRMLKAPINKAISFIEKQIHKIDIMIDKLENLTVDMVKQKESVLNKLHTNQERIKDNPSKGEERDIKREDIQK